MVRDPPLSQFTQDIADLLPRVDAETDGQYGNGIGSESEERQVDLLVDALQAATDNYGDLAREVPYPADSRRCDLTLPDGTPVEVKLIRYWRGNGDPEPTMYSHVFSPFHRNTLLTDAKDLHESVFVEPAALLGLFYTRSNDDSKTVESLPDQYTPEAIAAKVASDIDHWYGIDASVCEIARFDGLRHSIHKQGAVITWQLG